MWLRPILSIAIFGSLTLSSVAWSGGEYDFQREATKRMRLSVDLDELNHDHGGDDHGDDHADEEEDH